MNKLLTTMLALAAACVAAASHAAEIQGDARAGEKKTAMCLGCHGIVGYQASFPEVYKVPKISGQSAKYIVAALTAYRSGERKHPTMRGVASSLSDQDMADLAAYYSASGKVEGAAPPARSVKEPAARQAELLKKGDCVSCHGADFSNPVNPDSPKVAGQYPGYLFAALKAYKTENNAVVGRANGVMGAVAKQFSNAELKALADYLGSLGGELKIVPEARFH